MQAVIMAAGKSTRTYPLTLTRPKGLLPVANKPILAHLFDALAGIVDEVVLVVGYKAEMIREHFGDAYGDLRIRYVEQTDPRGTGDAVLRCADVVTGDFLAINGDDLYDPADLARLAQADQAALAKHIDDPRQFAIYEVTDDDRVIRLVEKPKEIFSHLSNIGAYKFPYEVFDILRETGASERGEIEITSAIQTLADRGGFYLVRAEGYWWPVGYPWTLLDVNAWYLEHVMEGQILGEVDPLAQLNGKVYVGPGAKVRAGAVIDGPVCIGPGAEVGPNCWLRPGSTVGPDCKVGQASELKNAILFEGAKAPHHNYVGDSIVGAHANLGCGTVTANFRHDGKNHRSMVKGELVDTGRRKLGAIIGDGVHTGIHIVIYPGRKLWPHTSTRPAQIVQEDLVHEDE